MTDPLPMFHAGKTRRCARCAGADWRISANGRLTCRDCEKAHKRERKDRRHRERGDRCGCGADATSLNPDWVVVHNWGGGACRVAPVKPRPMRDQVPTEEPTGAPLIPTDFLTGLLAHQQAQWDEQHGHTNVHSEPLKQGAPDED